ncbi:MAG: pyrroline-5-carboxylate reductase [Actinomycetota bacterium]|nr:pyrroline-5-carboxylate reductase [Actinomycetota bacterium]
MLKVTRLALIGAGQMGEALLKGILQSGALKPDGVVVSDVRKERLAQIKADYGVNIASDNVAAVKGADAILLAVKPQQLDEVLNEIADHLGESQVLISIAAGVSTKHIYDGVKKSLPVIRVMPNSPALVGASISVVSPGKHATREATELAAGIFSSVGEVVQLDEKFQNATTALSGSGPAYFYLFVEALIEAGIKAGLARDVATKLVVETMIGAGTMLKKTGKHPALLKDMVTSPGGTTIAALEVFEEAGFRAGVFRAIEAAMKRAKELGG